LNLQLLNCPLQVQSPLIDLTIKRVNLSILDYDFSICRDPYQSLKKTYSEILIITVGCLNYGDH